MKRKMKVLVALLTCMVLLSLTACGSKQNETDKSSSNTKNQEDKQTSSDAVLKVLTPFDTNVIGEEYLTALQEAADECGISIQAENIDSETYKTKIKVSLAGNELPDVFFTWGDSYTTPFIEAGAILPLNDAVTVSAYDFLTSYVTPYSDGNIYTAPYTANDYYACFYNKSVFETLGIEPPKDWDELLAVIDKANEAGVAAIGLANGARWQGDLLYNELVLRQDPKAYEDAMKDGGSFTSEPFLTAAEQVKELVDKNAFQKGYMQANEQEMAEMFYSDQIAMHMIGSWAFAPFIENMESNLGYFDFPKTGADSDYLTSSTVMFGTLPNGLCVSSDTPYPEAAAKFAVTYSKKINDAMVKKGRLGFIKTEVASESEIHPAYQEFMDSVSSVETIQPWWYGIVDGSIGEPMRDLSHKLFGGSISPEDFVKELDKIMKQS